MYESINELLEAYNISNWRFVCQITGIPERTMQNWLRGDRKPAPYMIGLIQAKIDAEMQLLTNRFVLDGDPTIFNQMR